jgi:hypothetical protein
MLKKIEGRLEERVIALIIILLSLNCSWAFPDVHKIDRLFAGAVLPSGNQHCTLANLVLFSDDDINNSVLKVNVPTLLYLP